MQVTLNDELIDGEIAKNKQWTFPIPTSGSPPLPPLKLKWNNQNMVRIDQKVMIEPNETKYMLLYVVPKKSCPEEEEAKLLIVYQWGLDGKCKCIEWKLDVFQDSSEEESDKEPIDVCKEEEDSENEKTKSKSFSSSHKKNQNDDDDDDDKSIVASPPLRKKQLQWNKNEEKENSKEEKKPKSSKQIKSKNHKQEKDDSEQEKEEEEDDDDQLIKWNTKSKLNKRKKQKEKEIDEENADDNQNVDKKVKQSNKQKCETKKYQENDDEETSEQEEKQQTKKLHKKQNAKKKCKSDHKEQEEDEEEVSMKESEEEVSEEEKKSKKSSNKPKHTKKKHKSKEQEEEEESMKDNDEEEEEQIKKMQNKQKHKRKQKEEIEKSDEEEHPPSEKRKRKKSAHLEDDPDDKESNKKRIVSSSSLICEMPRSKHISMIPKIETHRLVQQLRGIEKELVPLFHKNRKHILLYMDNNEEDSEQIEKEVPIDAEVLQACVKVVGKKEEFSCGSRMAPSTRGYDVTECKSMQDIFVSAHNILGYFPHVLIPLHVTTFRHGMFDSAKLPGGLQLGGTYNGENYESILINTNSFELSLQAECPDVENIIRGIVVPPGCILKFSGHCKLTLLPRKEGGFLFFFTQAYVPEKKQQSQQQQEVSPTDRRTTQGRDTMLEAMQKKVMEGFQSVIQQCFHEWKESQQIWNDQMLKEQKKQWKRWMDKCQPELSVPEEQDDVCKQSSSKTMEQSKLPPIVSIPEQSFSSSNLQAKVQDVFSDKKNDNNNNIVFLEEVKQDVQYVENKINLDDNIQNTLDEIPLDMVSSMCGLSTDSDARKDVDNSGFTSASTAFITTTASPTTFTASSSTTTATASTSTFTASIMTATSTAISTATSTTSTFTTTPSTTTTTSTTSTLTTTPSTTTASAITTSTASTTTSTSNIPEVILRESLDLEFRSRTIRKNVPSFITKAKEAAATTNSTKAKEAAMTTTSTSTSSCSVIASDKKPPQVNPKESPMIAGYLQKKLLQKATEIMCEDTVQKKVPAETKKFCKPKSPIQKESTSKSPIQKERNEISSDSGSSDSSESSDDDENSHSHSSESDDDDDDHSIVKQKTKLPHPATEYVPRPEAGRPPPPPRKKIPLRPSYSFKSPIQSHNNNKHYSKHSYSHGSHASSFHGSSSSHRNTSCASSFSQNRIPSAQKNRFTHSNPRERSKSRSRSVPSNEDAKDSRRKNGIYLASDSDKLVFVPSNDPYIATKSFFQARHLQVPAWQHHPTTTKSKDPLLHNSDQNFLNPLIAKVLLWERQNDTVLNLSIYRNQYLLGTLFYVDEDPDGCQMIRLYHPKTQNKLFPQALKYFTSRYLGWPKTQTGEDWQRRCMHSVVLMMTVLAIQQHDEHLRDWQTKPTHQWFGPTDGDNPDDGEKSKPSKHILKKQNRLSLSPSSSREDATYNNTMDHASSNISTSATLYYQCNLQADADVHQKHNYTTSSDGQRIMLKQNFNTFMNVSSVIVSERPKCCTMEHQAVMDTYHKTHNNSNHDSFYNELPLDVPDLGGEEGCLSRLLQSVADDHSSVYTSF